MIVPEAQRRFALEVVRRLREAGFAAYWAGGCVRDELLHRTPKDYDVATDARPEQIRDLFGQKKTLAIGAAFGVITVRGPKPAGMVEVATFRQDAAYSDGRHPDHVTFSSAREDAVRRDFTINGLFYDPLEDRVIDFVGGQEDLARRVIRAVGAPAQRFAEDKLRMLRAVRFSAAFGFSLDAETRAAIAQMAGQIGAVSAERIALEMDRMLVDPGRGEAVRLLLATGLAAAVLPEIVPVDDPGRQRLDRAVAVLERLEHPGFPLALAALLCEMVEPAAARQVCRRWRLSNHQTGRVVWLLEHRNDLAAARTKPWSVLQPLLVCKGIDDLLALHEAAAPAAADEVAYCRSLLAEPRAVLDPPPLVTGDDLLAHGVPAGPKFRFLLQRIREAQLDSRLHTQAEALAMADQLLADTN
jgi:tRNA nucleotidyltransferase/poly(A) polymerase